MQCTVNHGILSAFAAGLFLLPATGFAGDSAFIQQASGGAPVNSFVPARVPNSATPIGGNFVPTPELAVPGRSQLGNIARSVTIGSFNNVVQLQGGTNDLSSAAIIGGTHDSVGVLQGGNNDLSNVVMLGMQGTNVAVLQPPGAQPVNMLIARLPNGAILIRR